MFEVMSRLEVACALWRETLHALRRAMAGKEEDKTVVGGERKRVVSYERVLFATWKAREKNGTMKKKTYHNSTRTYPSTFQVKAVEFPDFGSIRSLSQISVETVFLFIFCVPVIRAPNRKNGVLEIYTPSLSWNFFPNAILWSLSVAQ